MMPDFTPAPFLTDLMRPSHNDVDLPWFEHAAKGKVRRMPPAFVAAYTGALVEPKL